MQILYCFTEGKSNMAQWQRVQMFDNLEDNGIKVKIFNPNSYENYDQANEKLLEQIKQEEYDFFMCPYNESKIYIETLKEMKKAGLPSVLICFDNLLIPFEHKNVCRYYDVVWLTSIENKSLFEKWSKGENKIITMPYASNPKLFKFSTEMEGEQSQKCVFLGSVYGSRVHELNTFLKLGAKVDLYTGNIKNQAGDYHGPKKMSQNIINYMSVPVGRKVIAAALKQKFIKETLDEKNENLTIMPSVPFEEISSVYASHALAVATTFARNTGNLKHPVPVVNLRSFEIPMCGGIEITAYNKELAEYFEEGKEILFYRDEDQLKELINNYTKTEMCTKRKEIKTAARKRAENEHTWYNRFTELYRILGISMKQE